MHKNLARIRNALFTAAMVIFGLELALAMVKPFLPLILGALILAGLGAWVYKSHFRL